MTRSLVFEPLLDEGVDGWVFADRLFVAVVHVRFRADLPTLQLRRATP